MTTRYRVIGVFLAWFALAAIVGCRFGQGFYGGEDLAPTVVLGTIRGTLAAAEGLLASPRAQAGEERLVAVVWLQELPDVRGEFPVPGEFLLRNVPPGNFRVVAKLERRTAAGTTVLKVRSAEVAIAPAATDPDAGTLTLREATQTAAGILRDADGNPLGGVTLRLWGEAFTTNPDGSYETPPLPPTDLPLEKIELFLAPGQADPRVIVSTFSTASEGRSLVETIIDTAAGGQGAARPSPTVVLVADRRDHARVAPGDTIRMWGVIFYDDRRTAPYALTSDWSVNQNGRGEASGEPLPEDLKRTIFNDLTGLPFDKARVEGFKVKVDAAPKSSAMKVTVEVVEPGKRNGPKAQLHFVIDGAPPVPDPVHPPVAAIVGSHSVLAGERLSLQVDAADPDHDTLAYAWSILPPGGTFSGITGFATSWTAPAATGVYEIRCVVSEWGKVPSLAVTATHTVIVVSDPIIVEPGMISGHVLDEHTRAPIGGALVIIANTSRSTVTDGNGFFRFRDLPPGTYDLVATRDGYKGRTFPGIVVP